MPNTSATGGPLSPAVSPTPLEGQALNRFLQQVVVGITALDGQWVRPRWQAESPNIPDAGEVWAAIGVVDRDSDTFPAITAFDTTLQKHEVLNILVSFYDLGTNGLADYYAALLRDGLMIPQNREVLTVADMGLVEVGRPVAVPSLLKQRWLYRVDMPMTIRREIQRVYPILPLVSAQITTKTDDGVTVVVTPH